MAASRLVEGLLIALFRWRDDDNAVRRARDRRHALKAQISVFINAENREMRLRAIPVDHGDQAFARRDIRGRAIECCRDIRIGYYLLSINCVSGH